MPRKESPVVQQRRLLSALRAQREDLELTQMSVAEALDWSVSKVIRIEKGHSRISVTDLKALLFHYGVTAPAVVDELVELARATKRPMWMSKYQGLSPQFAQFVELEAACVKVRYAQMSGIPDLLQTREYATNLLGSVEADPDLVRRAVDIRMHRQDQVGIDGPEQFFVIDESALHRMVGGPETMRRQLEHLKAVAESGHVSIQVLPFAAGLHPAMRGSYTILDLTEDDDDIVLLTEGIGGDAVLHGFEEARDHLNSFFHLERLALPVSETPRFIDRRLERFEGR